MGQSTEVVVRESGRGRPIVVLHGGMSDESAWARVADTMAQLYRLR